MTQRRGGNLNVFHIDQPAGPLKLRLKMARLKRRHFVELSQRTKGRISHSTFCQTTSGWGCRLAP